MMVGIFSVNCNKAQNAEANPTVAPAWVRKGSGAFSQDSRKSFYGVGIVSGMRNLALMQNTADNRARAEIAKIFETYSASLMKDYMASTSAGDMSKTSEEQNVEQAIKTFSANTLSGVEIVDRFRDPQTNTMYSLAKLDLQAFSDSLGRMKDLNSKVRDYVRANAERMHGELEKEEEKRANPTN